MTMLLAMTMLSTMAVAADLAGSVSFVIGEASVIDSTGRSKQLVRGDKVEAGQTLVTGNNGHIHLKMVDQAFLSVRPRSRLLIQDYHYDDAAPKNNRIKFVLEEGVARSITGRAGESTKENFRLNTPLAAIGIRGTDFVVMASNEVTRVHVQSGAVVMAPLDDGCLASTFGPCTSSSMRVLSAAMQNAYLELRSRSEVPVLVPIEKTLDAPNTVAPPRPEEPRVVPSEKQIKSGASIDSSQAVREVAAESLKTRVDVAASSSNGPPTSQGVPVVAPPVAVSPIEPVVVPPPPPAQFWWGRWDSYIKAGEEANSIAAAWDNQNPKRQVLYGNTVFGLFGAVGDVELPGAGTAKFKLADSAAYFMEGTKIAGTGQVSNASLSVDFAARRFETALTVSGSDAFPAVNMSTAGNVTWQGQLRNDANSNGIVVNGALSGDTSQAGYLFEQPISSTGSVVGATRWTR